MVQIFKKIMLCAAVAALGILVAGCPARVEAQSPSAPEREQLLNGLTILYGNRAGDPNVLLKLRVKSGAAFDLSGKAGTMSLLADAMFPEATTREYVSEQLGGRLDVVTTYDSIDVTISGKATELERMIELLRNAIINVNLSAESVATLREARLKELSAQQSSRSAVADRAVAARLFGSYPYANPPDGTVETVAKIERADLMLARERFLNADNAILAAIGGVEKPRLMRDLRQLLGPWQKGDRTVPATFRAPGAVDDRVLLIDAAADNNVEVRLAVRGLPSSDPNATAASVLAAVALSRWKAKVPELSQPLVRHESHALSGMFVFAAAAPANSAGKAIAAAKDVMQELTRSDPSDVEVNQAKASGLFASPNRQDPAEASADLWVQTETYKNIPNRVDDLYRLQPGDLRQTATRLFGNSAPLAIVVAGNATELQTQLGYKVELRTNQPEVKPVTETKPAKPPVPPIKIKKP